MVKLSAKAARAKFSSLLDQVENGEEVVIMRHGKPVARLVGKIPALNNKFPDLTAFRSRIKVRGKPASQLVIDERKKARF